jgi:hypothetical protein
VDDIVLANNDIQAISHLMCFLNNQFRLKDLGPLEFFLSLELHKVIRAFIYVSINMLWKFWKIADC